MFVKSIESTMRRISSAIPSTHGSILNNKWFLYFALIGALYELFNYYNRADMYAVTTFFLIGIVVSFFSKNMLVILVLAIALTRLIRYGRKLSEGFADEEDATEEEEETTEEETTEEETTEEEGFDGDEKKKGDEKKDSSTKAKLDETHKDVELSAANSKGPSAEVLLQKQKELMQTMKQLEPFLQKAESFIASNAKETQEKFTTLDQAYKTSSISTPNASNKK